MKKSFLGMCLLILSMISNQIYAQTQTNNSTQSNEVTPTTLPEKVSVQIVNATIGPSKVDGSHWSGSGKVSPTVTTQLSQLLLGATPYTSVIGLLGSSLVSGSGKPAPYGMVEVAIKGQYYEQLKTELVKTKGELERTYTPIFHLPAYQNVPFNDGTRFKITLYSKNLINPKPTPIGVAVINYKDLLKAYQEEKIYQVPVADQTQNQLLFIGIEVNAVGMK